MLDEGRISVLRSGGGGEWGMGLSGTILLPFWVVERGLVGLGRHKRMC